MTMHEDFAERLDEQLAEYAAEMELHKMQAKVIASLLRGGSLLFGYPIEIQWPEGQPYGRSNAELADWIDPPLRPAEGSDSVPAEEQK